LGYIIAEKSGGFRELVLSDFTKEALNQFKNKEKCIVALAKNKNCRKFKKTRQQLLMKERLLIPLFHRSFW
jgi:hypothetical protein